MWHKFQEFGVVYSAAAAAGEGLTGEVDAPQPPRLLWALAAGKQERGNFPAVPAAPGLDRISHNAQKLAPLTHPSGPRALSLHQSAHSSLSAFFSHSFSYPPLFLPFWRYTHTLSGACSSWPLPLRHILWRLWRPTFGPINAAFLPFSSNLKWNTVL